MKSPNTCRPSVPMTVTDDDLLLAQTTTPSTWATNMTAAVHLTLERKELSNCEATSETTLAIYRTVDYHWVAATCCRYCTLM